MPQTEPSPIRLAPKLEELERLMAYIEAFAEEHELRSRDANVLMVAAEELFANTVKHSHPPATEVEFSLVCEGETVAASYIDNGAAFDSTRHAVPDTSLPAEIRPIGGLGIHFIRETMQNFAYRREGGCNRLTFRRVLRA